MITSAITLMIITVIGGLVYFALERKLARAPTRLRADRLCLRDRKLTEHPPFRALHRRCS